MTTSTKSQSPRTTQQLTIVVATIRWNAARTGGRCADCHRQTSSDSDAMPRALVHIHAAQPPDQLVRLSQVAPGTHAESAAVDDWMRATMQRQRQPRRQSAVVSRAICWECAIRMLNGYLNTDGGTLTGVLSAITDDMWSALFMTCQPGHGQTLERFACNGRGKAPALADLFSLASKGLDVRWSTPAGA